MHLQQTARVVAQERGLVKARHECSLAQTYNRKLHEMKRAAGASYRAAWAIFSSDPS